MSSALVEVLFKDYRRRVLGLLLLHPDRTYHVREIARLTGTLPGTLHKELRKLEEAGILEKSSQGNQVTYRANRHCIVFEELASILRKTSGVADVLKAALASVADQIDAALVFGSVASGKATDASDIDLLVIGQPAYGDLVKSLYPVQRQLSREINPKLFTQREWKRAKKENSAFVREIFEKPVIEIIGKVNDLR